MNNEKAKNVKRDGEKLRSRELLYEIGLEES